MTVNPFKRIKQLEESLRQVSGKLADVEAFYRSHQKVPINPFQYADKFDQGWAGAVDALGRVLHPESIMDSEGFVQVGDDRG